MIGRVYNLCYWIRDDSWYIYLPVDVVSVAIVSDRGEYKIYSEDCDRVSQLRDSLRFVLGVDEDLESFYEIAGRDSLLSDFARLYRGWRVRSSDLWWSLVVGVCQQNASFRQGWRILHNIVKIYDKRVMVGREEILRPPTPQEVLEDSDRLVESGAGFRAETIIRIAKALTERSLDQEYLAKRDPEYIESVLREIRGVGSYTARLAIAFFKRSYRLPPVDRWLRKIASIVYGVSERDVERFWVERWGEWSALAAISATVALDAEPLTRALERVRRRELVPRLELRPSPVNMSFFCENF